MVRQVKHLPLMCQYLVQIARIHAKSLWTCQPACNPRAQEISHWIPRESCRATLGEKGIPGFLKRSCFNISGGEHPGRHLASTLGFHTEPHAHMCLHACKASCTHAADTHTKENIINSYIKQTFEGLCHGLTSHYGDCCPITLECLCD